MEVNKIKKKIMMDVMVVAMSTTERMLPRVIYVNGRI